MKRSGPPARRTPLETRSELRRTTALNASPLARSSVHAREAKRANLPKRRTASPVPTSLRIALAVRSGGQCEIAVPGCTVTATDLSHRKKVGAGGRKGAAAKAHHVLSNCLAACRSCHSLGHANPAEAYDAGWMLREHQDPLKEPVAYRGGLCLLGDDGSITPTTKED